MCGLEINEYKKKGTSIQYWALLQNYVNALENVLHKGFFLKIGCITFKFFLHFHKRSRFKGRLSIEKFGRNYFGIFVIEGFICRSIHTWSAFHSVNADPVYFFNIVISRAYDCSFVEVFIPIWISVSFF